MKKRTDKTKLEALCSGVKREQISGVEICKYVTSYKKVECKVLIQNHCYFNANFESEKIVLYK